MSKAREHSEQPNDAPLPWYLTGRGWTELIARRPALVVGLCLLVGGWIFIVDVNDWHLSPPVFFLCMGWAAVLVTIRFLWSAGVVGATEGVVPDDEGFDLRETRRDELLREKQSLLRAIKEIEFDRDLGKMSEVDSTDLVRVYRARAIEVIKALEGVDDSELDPRERIERDLAARLETLPSRSKRQQILAAAETDQRKASGKKRRRARGVDTLTGDTRPGSKKGTGAGTLPGTTDRRAFADDMIADAEAEDDDLPAETSEAAGSAEDRTS